VAIVMAVLLLMAACVALVVLIPAGTGMVFIPGPPDIALDPASWRWPSSCCRC
jgi:hypothetical protein